MNSSIVSKERFYELLGENKSYRKLKNIILDISYIYMALDNGMVYIYNYKDNSVLIPEKYEKQIDNLIKTTKLSFNSWKIAKINSCVPYICNEYYRNKPMNDTFEEGEYIIENIIWKDKYKLSIKTNGNIYYSESFLFCKEMRKLKLYSTELNRLIYFFNKILNEKGKSYKKSYK